MTKPASVDNNHPPKRWTGVLSWLVVFAILTGCGYLIYTQTIRDSTSSIPNHLLLFDSSVSPSEQTLINDTLKNVPLDSRATTTIKVTTSEQATDVGRILDAYVPVTSFTSVRQKVQTSDLSSLAVYVSADLTSSLRSSIATYLGLPADSIKSFNDISDIGDDDIAFISAKAISTNSKVLTFNGHYYLDDFTTGAVFRTMEIVGNSSTNFSGINFKQGFSKDTTLKFNMTGVTALTRVMQRKLESVGDPKYFSEKIGDFVADADLTHVSNEVSFKEGCAYNNSAFCSPPSFIETLKDSGVDIVELTGNHNNDVGSEYNTQTINLYKSLGWATVGGGLNTEEAAKPYETDMKGTKLTLLAYNYADSPNGGAIAGANKAGANSFDFDRIASEITTAKQKSDVVMVNVQYWECYAYPDGFEEFPECDVPIGEQEATFKKLIDLGADIVVGSSAHQPQTYTLYNGKPIYYGIGNLYFEQTSWPGTERGIILTHYFVGGKLIQTKLTPTVYDKDLQTRIMTDEEANYLLTRLHDAR